MGTWSLLNMTPEITPLAGETFGHNVKVTLRLKYTPSSVGRFVETPLLEWKEKIIMKEHHKRTSWVFQTNMYDHNPSSKTLRVWAARYIQAYRSAEGMAISAWWKGTSRLLDAEGRAVPLREIGAGIKDARRQADAVRDYMKRHTSILEIQVHDVPAINRPRPDNLDEHKERLLLFNIGVRGAGLRLQAQQYLDVNGRQQEGQWTRDCRRFWGRLNLDTRGFTVVPPPAMVADVRVANFAPGELW